MFEKIGSKLKGIATTFFAISFCGSFIMSIMLIVANVTVGGILSIFVLLFGGCFGWIGACGIYGFGELIDKVCSIEKNLKGGQNGSTEEPTVSDTASDVSKKAFKCPRCQQRVYFGDSKCTNCNQFFAWDKLK